MSNPSVPSLVPSPIGNWSGRAGIDRFLRRMRTDLLGAWSRFRRHDDVEELLACARSAERNMPNLATELRFIAARGPGGPG